MPISFYHFQFRPTLAVKCIPDLRVRSQPMQWTMLLMLRGGMDNVLNKNFWKWHRCRRLDSHFTCPASFWYHTIYYLRKELLWTIRSLGPLWETTSSWRIFGPARICPSRPSGAQAVWPTPKGHDTANTITKAYNITQANTITQGTFRWHSRSSSRSRTSVF